MFEGHEKYGVKGATIRNELVTLPIDGVVRYPITNRSTVNAQMEDLRQFGVDGNHMYFGSVTDNESQQMVVVRIG